PRDTSANRLRRRVVTPEGNPYPQTTRPARAVNGQLGRAGGAHTQWEMVFSTPTPVSERTSISRCLAGNSSFLPRNVPTAPSRNASGIDTIPGLDSGKSEKSTPGIIDVSLPDTAGES